MPNQPIEKPMPAPESVKQLLDTFANNIDFYKCGMGD